MPNLSRWEPVVEALRAKGFDAQLTVGFMDLVSIDVDLGNSWSASLSTGESDLDAFKSSVPVLVNLDGPGMPGEGYQVSWWPPTTDIKRIANAVVPLLERVMSTVPKPTEEDGPGALDVATAEGALRGMLAALGTPVTDPRLVWRTFTAFALRPVAGVNPSKDEDLVLFETGHDEIILTRQFTRHGEMEQLMCTLHVSGELPQATVWGVSGPLASDWIAEVEAHQVFRAAMAAGLVGLDVRQTLVLRHRLHAAFASKQQRGILALEASGGRCVLYPPVATKDRLGAVANRPALPFRVADEGDRRGARQAQSPACVIRKHLHSDRTRP